MKTLDLINNIRGVQTLESIKSKLGITAKKAVYFVYRLRKKGYVKTRYDSTKKRIYYISLENVLGGTSYVDIMNKYSPIKLSSAEVYKIYGRDVSIEETIVYAVKTRKLRYILASLALFKKINNWNELFRLAKQNNLLREVGALYDLSTKIIHKIKKMDKKFRYHALPKANEPHKYIIPDLRSSDYKNIETVWKIYIPFNAADLVDYSR
jgi:DNA-binding Lrp family transcriptional regulator